MNKNSKLELEEKIRLLNELFIKEDIEKTDGGGRKKEMTNSKKRSKAMDTDRNKVWIEGKREIWIFYKEAQEMYDVYFPKKAASLSYTDLIESAIDKLSTGKREWDVKKYPNTLVQLRKVYESELKNIYNKERIKRRRADTEDREIRDVPDGKEIMKLSVAGDRIEEDIDTRNKVRKIKEYVSEKMSATDYKVLECLDSTMTNEEIGRAAGIAEKTAENIKTKLRKQLREKFPEYCKTE